MNYGQAQKLSEHERQILLKIHEASTQEMLHKFTFERWIEFKLLIIRPIEKACPMLR